MDKLERKKKKKEYDINYRKKNAEKDKKIKKIYYENNKEKAKVSRLEIKEKKKEYDKIYYQNNKEKIKEYSQNNKEEKSKYNYIYFKKRIKTDSLFKLRINISNLIRASIRNNNYTKKSKTFEILGCECKEFKNHLERQFKKGMNWDNIGQWHLDHIYPASLAKDEVELIRLNHYTNFQPMWAKENISKGNKIIGNTQIKLI